MIDMNINHDYDPRRCYECGEAGGKQIEFGHETKYPRVLCFTCITKMYEMTKKEAVTTS